MTDQTADVAADPAPAEKAQGKSIINPKYRGKYKTPDWLGEFVAINASKTKVIPAAPATEATEQVGEIGKPGFHPAKAAKEATPERTVTDGVDIDALFKLGADNGLDLTKFKTQVGGHGFEGRFRMTVRNMLQTVAKQRHGLIDASGEFVAAPEDWLHLKGAPTNATHNPDGSKIAKPAPVAEAASESKLIKTDAEPAADPKPAPVAKAKPVKKA